MKEFDEFPRTKPELIYNLITGLASKDIDSALKLFDYFKNERIYDQTDDNAEYIIDAVHNIVVGTQELTLDQSLSIYNSLKENTAFPPNHLNNAISFSGLTVSIIGKFPTESPEAFRQVLANAYRIHRAFPDNDEIRHETCAVIANFSNLLDGDQLDHGIRLLKRFYILSKNDRDGDIVHAWKHILYHIFLLLIMNISHDEITEKNINLAMYQLIEILPQAKDFKDDILLLLQKDIDEDEAETRI